MDENPIGVKYTKTSCNELRAENDRLIEENSDLRHYNIKVSYDMRRMKDEYRAYSHVMSSNVSMLSQAQHGTIQPVNTVTYHEPMIGFGTAVTCTSLFCITAYLIF